jgi:hypothetical protein
MNTAIASNPRDALSVMLNGNFGDTVKVPLKVTVVEQIPRKTFSKDMTEEKTCPVCFGELGKKVF